jgi:purine-binding chemotaxis protein CheW
MTFMLAGQLYGVDILNVQEIRTWEGVTRIPNEPPHVIGVVNIRGAIVPVYCLRRRFGLPAASVSPTTVVIVLRTGSADCKRITGIVVDEVTGVVTANEGQITDPPRFEREDNNGFVHRMVMSGEQTVMMLDVTRLLAFDDVDKEPDSEATAVA